MNFKKWDISKDNQEKDRQYIGRLNILHKELCGDEVKSLEKAMAYYDLLTEYHTWMKDVLR